MKKIYWSPDKNGQLKKLRNVTFEELLNARFVTIEKHPVKKHQQLMLFEFKKYIWVVPYVENNNFLFLKTAFKSRKYTKKYLGR